MRYIGRNFCGLTKEFVYIMKSCWLPYIFMVFKEQVQIGSDPM